MDFQVVIPGADFFCESVLISRPCCDPFSEKAENGSDRKSRRRAVPSEESRNSYHGRHYVSCYAAVITALYSM